MSPEALRLSARSGRPPPRLTGAPVGSRRGGGGQHSPPRAEYSAPGRAVPLGWASGSPAASRGPLPPVPAPRKGHLADASAGGSRCASHACRTHEDAVAPATAAGWPTCPRAQHCATPRRASRHCSHCGLMSTGHKRHGANLTSDDSGRRGRATPTALRRCARTISYGRAGAPPLGWRGKYPARKLSLRLAPGVDSRRVQSSRQCFSSYCMCCRMSGRHVNTGRSVRPMVRKPPWGSREAHIHRKRPSSRVPPATPAAALVPTSAATALVGCADGLALLWDSKSRASLA